MSILVLYIRREITSLIAVVIGWKYFNSSTIRRCHQAALKTSSKTTSMLQFRNLKINTKGTNHCFNYVKHLCYLCLEKVNVIELIIYLTSTISLTSTNTDVHSLQERHILQCTFSKYILLFG